VSCHEEAENSPGVILASSKNFGSARHLTLTAARRAEKGETRESS
jgi:hypothetical protein